MKITNTHNETLNFPVEGKRPAPDTPATDHIDPNETKDIDIIESAVPGLKGMVAAGMITVHGAAAKEVAPAPAAAAKR